MYGWLTTGVVCLMLAVPLDAQTRVTVELRVSIPAEGGRRLPVTGRFWLVGGNDSTPVLTSHQGIGRAEVLTGRYRIRSYQPVGIGALRYYWDVPVAISRGALVELNERNSQSTPGSGAVAMEEPIAVTELPDYAPASVGAAMAAPPSPVRQPGDPGYKDPGVGTLLGVLIPGGGHLYAGEVGKGAGLLAVGSLGGALLISQMSCGDTDGCDGPRIAFGALAYLGAVIYSAADAGPAARRSNRIVPEFAVRVLPRGQVGLGLRIPLP